MEERLDDAINVLRNHCEPQISLPISNIEDAQFVGSAGAIGTPALQDSCAEGAVSVKMERLPVPITNSSKIKIYLQALSYWTQ